MAKVRNWDSLSPAYRDRLSRAGMTKSEYQAGVNLSKARGHSQTPEHPREAIKHPEKYKKYLEKKERKEGPGGPVGLSNKDLAYLSMYSQLRYYIKYNDETVRRNIYGDDENNIAPAMSDAQARWTANADVEMIRERASEQYYRNPWFYH